MGLIGIHLAPLNHIRFRTSIMFVPCRCPLHATSRNTQFKHCLLVYDFTCTNRSDAKWVVQYAPKTLSLHRLTAHLANRIYDTYNVAIPELNAAPVLWRVVQECFCGTRTHTCSRIFQ